MKCEIPKLELRTSNLRRINEHSPLFVRELRGALHYKTGLKDTGRNVEVEETFNREEFLKGLISVMNFNRQCYSVGDFLYTVMQDISISSGFFMCLDKSYLDDLITTYSLNPCPISYFTPTEYCLGLSKLPIIQDMLFRIHKGDEQEAINLYIYDSTLDNHADILLSYKKVIGSKS